MDSNARGPPRRDVPRPPDLRSWQTAQRLLFDLIAAEYLRDIEPGEVLVVTRAGMRSLRPFEPAPKRFCIPPAF